MKNDSDTTNTLTMTADVMRAAAQNIDDLRAACASLGPPPQMRLAMYRTALASNPVCAEWPASKIDRRALDILEAETAPKFASAAAVSRPLAESVIASGRHVHVTTYHDGPESPVRASLLFRSAEDAAEVARALLVALGVTS